METKEITEKEEEQDTWVQTLIDGIKELAGVFIPDKTKG